MDAVKSSHPTDEVLASYGHGRLDDPSAEAVSRHLDRCEDCQRRVGELSSDSFLGRIREARKPPGGEFEGALMGDATLSFAQGKVPAGPPPSADTIPPGLSEHPDYVLKRELGRGGMGVVYLAHNTMMGRDEVLKVINRHVMEKPGVLERFQREIRAVAKLRHPNIVAAYTAFRIDGGLVFAMEYVEGLDLARMVKLKGALPVVHASYFAHQAALGLQHAHERGMIHRDIKPHNLMLTGDGRARIIKILDFGLAKAGLEQEVDTGLTREGQALGTPDYIAPEQILNAVDVDIRADIYSLGATLYYLLTGRPPFTGTSLYDIYQSHISRDISPLNLVRPEIPSELAALVAKMMAKEPKRRFQTPAEIAQALTPFFKKPSQTTPVPVSAPTTVPAPAKSRRNVPVARPPAPKQAAVPANVAPPPQPPAPASPPQVSWDSLIAIPVNEDVTIRPPTAPLKLDARPSRRRIKRPVIALGAGILALGFLALWLGSLRFQTENGTVVLEGLKDDDIVEIDGRAVPQVTIKKTPEGEPYLTLTAEPHGIRVVTKGGSEIFARGELTVRPNGLETLYVKPVGELNSLAWKLATSQDSEKRNGPKALRLATTVCEQDHYQSPIYLDTLAAACAEVGDFRNAAKWQVQALSRAKVIDLESYHSRLLLYREEKPYRTGPSPEGADAAQGAGRLNGLAWSLSTDADPSKRDAKKAYTYANQAVRINGYKNPSMLDTLAAACAENGYFDEAVMWETKAIEKNNLDYYRDRLELFRQKKPYRQEELPADAASASGTSGSNTFVDDAMTDKGVRKALLIPPDGQRTAFVYNGDWRSEEGELVQSNSDDRASIGFGDMSWSEYDLSVEVNSFAGIEGSWTVFHSIDVANTFNYYTGADGHRSHGLAIVSDGKPQHIKVPGRMSHNEWHTVSLEVRGPSVVCRFDGEEVLRRENLPHDHGGVGLGTYHTAARFRNLRITSPDGTILWEGMPALP